eukprot:TRINITY_DN9081_c0_g1_i1.p1 TRINITY_DN9081_c0_g1~~TRINITY_DN9081_c0_g1_i1.p1  ORF type:complete len:1126 (-),score=322.47 TRINITY_DN9081_c0_g1_i1:181-3558(-)
MAQRLIRHCKSGTIKQVLEVLEKKANPNDADVDGWTALHHVCKRGDVELIKILVEHNADINTCGGTSYPPLLNAVIHRHLAATRVMLDLGADANADRNSYTALHYAVRNGDEDIARALIFREANVNAVESVSQHTPLHIACDKGHDSLVRLLVEVGAAVDKRDARGATPLHYAAQHGHTNAALVLIEHGANPEDMDDSGKLPVHLASSAGHETLCRLLSNVAPPGTGLGTSNDLASATAVNSSLSGSLPKASSTARSLASLPRAADTVTSPKAKVTPQPIATSATPKPAAKDLSTPKVTQVTPRVQTAKAPIIASSGPVNDMLITPKSARATTVAPPTPTSARRAAPSSVRQMAYAEHHRAQLLEAEIGRERAEIELTAERARNQVHQAGLNHVFVDAPPPPSAGSQWLPSPAQLQMHQPVSQSLPTQQQQQQQIMQSREDTVSLLVLLKEKDEHVSLLAEALKAEQEKAQRFHEAFRVASSAKHARESDQLRQANTQIDELETSVAEANAELAQLRAQVQALDEAKRISDEQRRDSAQRAFEAQSHNHELADTIEQLSTELEKLREVADTKRKDTALQEHIAELVARLDKEAQQRMHLEANAQRQLDKEITQLKQAHLQELLGVARELDGLRAQNQEFANQYHQENQLRLQYETELGQLRLQRETEQGELAAQLQRTQESLSSKFETESRQRVAAALAQAAAQTPVPAAVDATELADMQARYETEISELQLKHSAELTQLSDQIAALQAQVAEATAYATSEAQAREKAEAIKEKAMKRCITEQQLREQSVTKLQQEVVRLQQELAASQALGDISRTVTTDLEKQVSTLSAEVTAARIDSARLRAQLDEAHEALDSHRSGSATGEPRVVVQSSEEDAQRIADLQQQVDELSSSLQERDEHIATLRAEAAATAAAAQHSPSDGQQSSPQLEKLKQQLKERDAVAEQLQTELRDLKVKLVPLQADAEKLIALKEEVAGLQQKAATVAHTTSRSSALKQEVLVLRRELDRWKDDAAKSQAKATELQGNNQKLRAVVTSLRKQLNGDTPASERRPSRDLFTSPMPRRSSAPSPSSTVPAVPTVKSVNAPVPMASLDDDDLLLSERSLAEDLPSRENGADTDATVSDVEY